MSAPEHRVRFGTLHRDGTVTDERAIRQMDTSRHEASWLLGYADAMQGLEPFTQQLARAGITTPAAENAAYEAGYARCRRDGWYATVNKPLPALTRAKITVASGFAPGDGA